MGLPFGGVRSGERWRVEATSGIGDLHLQPVVLLREAHDAILHAIEAALDPASGAPRTPDIGGTASTTDLGRAIASAL